MNLIISILLSGAPGFITYTFLEKVNLINYTNNQNFEKTMTVTTFTVINAFLTIIVLEIINKHNALLTIIISSIIMATLSFIIYPLAFKFFNNKINLMKSDLSTLSRIMDERPKDTQRTQCYIYDFNDNFIASGTLNDIELQSSNLSIVYDRNFFEYESVLKLYDETKNLNKDIYIDIVNKIKIYLIHY